MGHRPCNQIEFVHVFPTRSRRPGNFNLLIFECVTPRNPGGGGLRYNGFKMAAELSNRLEGPEGTRWEKCPPHCRGELRFLLGIPGTQDPLGPPEVG